MGQKGTFQFEVALSVSDYLKEAGTTKEAFENCKADTDAALEIAQEELTEVGVAEALYKMGGMKIRVAKFVEFDSSNPTHAGGYFLIEVTGAKKDIENVEKLYRFTPSE